MHTTKHVGFGWFHGHLPVIQIAFQLPRYPTEKPFFEDQLASFCRIFLHPALFSEIFSSEYFSKHWEKSSLSQYYVHIAGETVSSMLKQVLVWYRERRICEVLEPAHHDKEYTWNIRVAAFRPKIKRSRFLRKRPQRMHGDEIKRLTKMALEVNRVIKRLALCSFWSLSLSSSFVCSIQKEMTILRRGCRAIFVPRPPRYFCCKETNDLVRHGGWRGSWGFVKN